MYGQRQLTEQELEAMQERFVLILGPDDELTQKWNAIGSHAIVSHRDSQGDIRKWNISQCPSKYADPLLNLVGVSNGYGISPPQLDKRGLIFTTSSFIEMVSFLIHTSVVAFIDSDKDAKAFDAFKDCVSFIRSKVQYDHT